MSYLLLVFSVQKTSLSQVFLVWKGGTDSGLLTMSAQPLNQRLGERRTDYSFCGHLFPSQDRGNSKLALLQDLGGKNL